MELNTQEQPKLNSTFNNYSNSKKSNFTIIGIAGFTGFLLAVLIVVGVGFTYPQVFQKIFPSQGVQVYGLNGSGNDQLNIQNNNANSFDYNTEKQMILNILGNGFIGNIPSGQELSQGELKGLVASLGDKYTTYFTCKEYEAFQSDINQSFEGIGARFEDQGDKIVVTDILSGYPAEKAGLLKGDELISVNGKSARDLGLTKSIEAIRGPANSKVTLVVNRIGNNVSGEQQLSFEIIRAQIKEKMVSLEIKEDIAIIKITSFGADLANLMSDVAKNIRNNSNIKNIILDLRDNGGGLLSQSVVLTSYFIDPEKVVVKEKTKNGSEQLNSRRIDNSLKDYPLAILVNASTASASEITAGALQDYQKGKVYGQKTFGKGVVQDLKDLTGCNKLKYTIAEWLTPNSRQINGKGITPDVLVNTKEDSLDRAINDLLGEK